ncbi:hypothetical protein H3H12_22985 [Serratia marcescens]|nr:hypothetical protein [Serratia marcescens]EME1468107.1 hypothetical protein [Serratia marcescens]MBN3904718.1 hypothetical protein [Serratia marcescens]MBN3916220.1 hypothetical protein [Serratia marcescens]MBN3921242.1 hypothetical protein [Serratia marcescens]MBN3937821.1 hypothetical protein [Serratia marcescens]
MKNNIVITGRAFVEFRRVISGLDNTETREIINSHDLAAQQVDLEHCHTIVEINDIDIEVNPQ